jgi:hypothetical protein
MDVSGVSLLQQNKTVCGRGDNVPAQDGTSDSGGWKFVTVQEGDVEYTYIVIGKNMRVLIGETSVKDKDEDKKSASDKENSASKAEKTLHAEKNDSNKVVANKVDFLTDYRMFALTASYQKKIRETMKNMENHIGAIQHGSDKVNGVEAIEKADNNRNESGT